MTQLAELYVEITNPVLGAPEYGFLNWVTVKVKVYPGGASDASKFVRFRNLLASLL
jgi:hypothetical protein